MTCGNVAAFAAAARLLAEPGRELWRTLDGSCRISGERLTVTHKGKTITYVMPGVDMEILL